MSAPTPDNLSNCLLVATPALSDPGFSRTIVWIHSHSPGDGATGIILNRPAGVTLGELAADKLPAGLPADAGIFYGGPVALQEPVVIEMGWNEEQKQPGLRIFRPGVQSLEEDDDWRVFIGHSGWSAGQLEKELAQGSWIVLLPMPFFFPLARPHMAWQEVLSHMDPRLRLLAASPEALWKN